MDEFLFFVITVRLKGNWIAFPVLGDGALFIFTWQTVTHSLLHCAGLLLLFRSILSCQTVPEMENLAGMLSFQLRWLTGSAAIRNEGVGSLEVDALIRPCEHMVLDASGPLDKLRNRYCPRSHLIGWIWLPVVLIIPRAELSMLYWLLQQLLQPQGN